MFSMSVIGMAPLGSTSDMRGALFLLTLLAVRRTPYTKDAQDGNITAVDRKNVEKPLVF